MPVSISTTELDDSRIRLDVEVPGDAVEQELQRVAQAAGKDMKIAGFRKGHVPPQVVIQHLGRPALLNEAVQHAMPEWYEEAVNAAGIAPVGHPKVDIGDVPEGKGNPLTFTVEVSVRPKATLGEWKGVEAPKREAEAPDEAVDAEVERLREALASLEPVERAAQSGDFLVLDYTGYVDDEAFQGGEGRGQTIELGAGRLIPGFEDQLVGATPGEDRTLNVSFPDVYGAEELAGKEARFETNVKEVREKRMPELDDEFALQAGGFDTLDELREDISRRLREADERNADREFREAALDAVVAGANVEIPDTLVEARARELWDQMLHSLSHRGINKDAYLRIAQKTEDELLAEARPDAEQALRREAVLAAVIESEGIVPSEGDVLDVLQQSALQQGTEPEKLRKRLEQQGRLDEVIDDIAQRQAVELLVERAGGTPTASADEGSSAS